MRPPACHFPHFIGSQFNPPVHPAKQQPAAPPHPHPHSHHQLPPLPDHIVDGLRRMFNKMDIKNTGQIPYGYLRANWHKTLSTSSAAAPTNLLAILGRISPPPDGFITFPLFLKAAQIALRERIVPMPNSLKRVKSEGRLLGDKGDGHNANDDWGRQRPNHSQERERPKSRSSTPAMGLAGRKLDHRDYNGHLMRMRKASRSQPQLNELFYDDDHDDDEEEEGEEATQCRKPSLPNGLRNLKINEKNVGEREMFALFNQNFVGGSQPSRMGPNEVGQIVGRARKQKSTKAPPPPLESPVIFSDDEHFANPRNGNGVLLMKRRGRVVPIPSISSPTNGLFGPRQTAPTGPSPIKWPTIPSPPQQQQQQQQSPSAAAAALCQQHYAAEEEMHSAQVAKHKRLLEEEFQIVHCGQQKANELLAWYNGRVESLAKRRRMLLKGMVALDSAVHEQKLNFHRAQIAEMNRRIKSFLATSENGGFPGHGNGQKDGQKPIRNHVLPPPPFNHQTTTTTTTVPTTPMPAGIIQNNSQPQHQPQQHSTNSCSFASSAGSSNNSSASSSGSSFLLDGAFSSASETEFLRAQNDKLMRDVHQLAYEVAQLRLQHSSSNNNQRHGNGTNDDGHRMGNSKMKFLQELKKNGIGVANYHSASPKGTLL